MPLHPCWSCAQYVSVFRSAEHDAFADPEPKKRHAPSGSVRVVQLVHCASLHSFTQKEPEGGITGAGVGGDGGGAGVAGQSSAAQVPLLILTHWATVVPAEEQQQYIPAQQLVAPADHAVQNAAHFAHPYPHDPAVSARPDTVVLVADTVVAADEKRNAGAATGAGGGAGQ